MKPESPRILRAGQSRYLLASLFVTGAATLILEIAGTRVISPYYGSSLYCWSALITVTLVALAGGYKFGGAKAAGASLALFARLISTAGLCVALVPAARSPVLRSTASLGVQLGALASAAVLVAPSLFLLGAMGPLAVRLHAESLAGAGESAGDVFAVSTLGSVAGAALAGFVLIPRLAVSTIFYGLAVLLLFLGALGSWLSTARLPAAALAAAAAAALLGFWPRTRPETNVRLNRESQYAQIKVVDSDGHRYLMVNGTSQSVASADTLESTSPYIHVLEFSAAINPSASRALVVGIGGGLLPTALERYHGITTDAVDVDPAMIETARDFFGYRPKGTVTAGDGRLTVEGSPGGYDIAVLDAFSGELPPFHLFTIEAFQAMRRALKPGGVFALNLVSLVTEPGDEAWLSAYKTLRSVFPEVRVFEAQAPYLGMANLVFFCSEKPWTASPAQARAEIRGDVAFALAHEIAPDPAGLERGVFLTDDHAPIDSLLARTSLLWRRSLQQNLSDVMLY